MSAGRRLFASALAVVAWLVLLYLGIALGGAVHLLLVAGIALFPWRTESTAEP